MGVSGLRRIDFECSFAHWFLCFPKSHWLWIETSPSRQFLDSMVGKVIASKESAKIKPFNEIKINSRRIFLALIS